MFAINLNDYSIQQLTDLEHLPLPLEVEFFSACKNPIKDEAFFWYGTDLISLNLKTLQSSAIFKLDPGWKNSMTSCSADGKYVYFSIYEDLTHLYEVD